MLNKKVTNLAYFASGTYIDKEYKKLPYDNVFLIDKCFREKENKGKVHCLNLDAIKAIDFFKKENIKLDAVIIINEGLCEGGGEYSLGSDAFFGYLMQVLSDEYIHIACPSYYNALGYKLRFDYPYKKKELSINDSRYITPSMFSIEYAKKSKVYHMKKEKARNQNFQINNILCSFIRDSIWRFVDNYSAVFIDINGDSFKLVKKENLYNIKSFSFDQIISLAKDEKWISIGLIPWNKGQYSRVVMELLKQSSKMKLGIYFHYLNKKDYKQLKKDLEILEKT